MEDPVQGRRRDYAVAEHLTAARETLVARYRPALVAAADALEEK
jgi:hypothetical protein